MADFGEVDGVTLGEIADGLAGGQVVDAGFRDGILHLDKAGKLLKTEKKSQQFYWYGGRTG